MILIDDDNNSDDDSDDVNTQSCGTARFRGGGTQQQRTDILNAHRKLCANFNVAKGKVANNNMYRTWFGKYKKGGM